MSDLDPCGRTWRILAVGQLFTIARLSGVELLACVHVNVNAYRSPDKQIHVAR